MSARDRLSALLDRLVALTGEGKVEWRQAQTAPRSFEFVTGAGEKIVIDSRDDDGSPPFDLLLYSAEGNLLSQLQWVEIYPGQQVPRTDVQLRNLYESARDRVSGATETIDRILKELPSSADDIPF